MRYKFVEGQRLFMGKKPVTVIEKREFWGQPSYRVEWYNKEGHVEAAILKENELDVKAW